MWSWPLKLTLVSQQLWHNSTIGNYHDMYLPGLVKICQTVPEISRWKGFMWLILASSDLDLWPPDPKVDHFTPLPRGPIVRLASKSVQLCSQYSAHKFGNRWKDGQTNGQVENIMPLPARGVKTSGEKCGQQASITAEERWRQQRKRELDEDMWSVDYSSLGVTRHNSDQVTQTITLR